jgi:hypothetical protein
VQHSQKCLRERTPKRIGRSWTEYLKAPCPENGCLVAQRFLLWVDRDEALKRCLVGDAEATRT